jgi:lipocalin
MPFFGQAWPRGVSQKERTHPSRGRQHASKQAPERIMHQAGFYIRRAIFWDETREFLGAKRVAQPEPRRIDSRKSHDGINGVFEGAVYNNQLAEDGTIETTFRFNKGGFDGPDKTYKPRGYIQDRQSNAVWGVQFVWPFKVEYRIICLSNDYERTIIGRTKRDYVWVMARQPSISEEDYRRLVKFIGEQGYESGKLRCVPHAPPSS